MHYETFGCFVALFFLWICGLSIEMLQQKHGLACFIVTIRQGASGYNFIFSFSEASSKGSPFRCKIGMLK